MALTILVGQAMWVKASSHSDFLRIIYRISDDAAADGPTKVLSPKLLAVGDIERIEIAAQIAEEDDYPPPSASCR